MNFKFSRFVFLAFASVVFVASAGFYGDIYSNTVFAEGDIDCNGKIIGKTNISNPNFGQLDFDSHPSPYSDANKVTDLSVVGLTQGLAPADRNLAACIDSKTTVAVPLIANEYAIKGYVWNTNLGFFSLFCDGGKNQGVACGGFNYGTKVSVPDGAGKRLLSGNAWNPGFGYVQFAGGGAIPYQVSADKDGKLSGYAWTEAKVWVDMSGVTIQIPGKKIVQDVVTGPCTNKPFACSGVTDPDKGLNKVLGTTGGKVDGSNGVGGISIGSDPDVKVANGVDEYQIHLYLKEADGVTAMDISKYNLGPIVFEWNDTVKLKQDFNSTVGTGLNNVESPLTQGSGGITYKPIKINSLDEFTNLGDGHYVLNKTIKSYAPTTDMNVSYTTGMKPNVVFKNEVFFNAMEGTDNKIPVLKEPNRLKLSKIDIPIIEKATGQPPVTPDGKVYNKVLYPNGKDGLFLHFRPAVEVSTLYSGNSSDSITGFRSIPFSFKVGGKKDSKLADNGTANVDFILDYDKTLTDDNCVANGEDVVGGGFDVVFVDGAGGKTYSWQKVSTSLYNFDLQAVAKLSSYDNMSDTEKATVAKPCSQVVGPSLYSVVKYTVDGKSVSYYSNKLPRVVSTIVNPVAVVHGNIYASKAFSPSAAVETQETGSKSVNLVRDGLYENIASKITGVVLKKDLIANAQNTKECTLGDSGSLSGCSGPPISKTLLNGTSVSVYENTDVHIDLSTPSSYKDNDSIIVMNGNVFIDSDIYKEGSTEKMQIITLRPYSAGCNKGNVYVKNIVKNINANVFSDCSLFSYKDGQVFDDATGIPKWNDFAEKTDSLNTQLRWVGSIASHNSVGGYDLDKDLKSPKTYIFDGFRAWDTAGLSTEKRLEVQAYDLNYLRLFKLSIQTDELGKPIDQSCKKALSLEEMLQISQFKLGQADDTIYGENGDPCDGIDALTPYDVDSKSGGDLVAPIDDVTLAKGLDATKDFEPVYVIFSISTSPLFKR